ncbi:distal tail protein Dit [Paenibacillus elgii]|uniref:distal tail protein Dit n=1 Tax=Paenibacillus elgii TaxID=189691 RepID=UPI00203AF77B|nr:distal tail protein Dit [Paenibacillus elgii]MCM3274161.1 phage tail family protein [Paenibacillus elgii]
MKEGIDFYYDGVYSLDMGLINCKVDSGFFEEPFLSQREIHEVSVRGRDKPYFQGVKRSPLSFSLTFAFVDYYDEEKIRAVARWLNSNTYKPFYTSDNPERIFYCMLESESTLLHNGLKQGYVNVKFRCDSPYSYSPVYTSKLYEWDEVPVTFGESTFSNGTLTNVTTDANGDLILSSAKMTWQSISSTMTWKDL